LAQRRRVRHACPKRQVDVLVRPEAAQREEVPERSPGEQDDEQDGEQEAGDGIADDDHPARPHVEARAVLHRLADAERDGDGVGEQRHPQPERDRHRHLLADQLQHADVAEIALAEIEARVVPQHQAEALQRRLVEAELLFELLDELRVEPLRAAIFRVDALVADAALAARHAAEVAAGAPAGDARRGVDVGALQLRDHPLDRPARRELHHDEADRHDADHGRDDEQDTPQDIGAHQSALARSGDGGGARDPPLR
jgi:hypothetical protein